MKKLIMILFVFITAEVCAQDSPGEYTVKNARINSEMSDFGTAFYGKNKVVFAAPKQGFTFNREEYNGQPFLDLYIAEVTDDGQIIKKQKMPGDINSKYHEGVVCFSKDMKTVYFSANKYVKKKKKNKKKEKTKTTINIHLFKANINDSGEWTDIEPLPFNNATYSTGHPVLNRDDSKLYFISDRPESIGLTDIYVVDINEDGSFGIPRNLGPDINTPEREMFPFIGEDNILYFSSDGYPGYGELDVYASKIFDNTVSKPINLEEPVNSEMDDFAYIINDTKHKGYFSSNREGGKGDDDIYAFEADPPIFIECVQEISGVVKNIVTQELIPDVKVILFDDKGKELKSFMSDENDATFSFTQACDTSYKLKGYLEGYLIGEMDIKTVNDLNAEPIEIIMNMEVDPSRESDLIADLTTSENSVDINDGSTAQETEIAEKNTEDLNPNGDALVATAVVVGAAEKNRTEIQSKEELQASETGENSKVSSAKESDPQNNAQVVSVASTAEISQKQQDDIEKAEVADAEINVEPADKMEGAEQNVNVSENEVAATEIAALNADKNDPSLVDSSEESKQIFQDEDLKEQNEAVIRSKSTEIASNKEEVAKLEGDSTLEQKGGLAVNAGAEGGVIAINTIYFDFDKFNIRFDAKLELDKIVNVMRENPEVMIKVSSHTDVRGRHKYNDKLSDNRADKTMGYLIDRGIERGRISGKGYGEVQLAEKCKGGESCTPFQHQLNRRSEFLVFKDGLDNVVVRSSKRRFTDVVGKNNFTANSGAFTNYNFAMNTEAYTVQLGAFQGQVQTKIYSNLTNLFNYRYEDGLNRYYSGLFETSAEARSYMRVMRKKGFEGAFVVGLKGEDRF